MSCVVLPDKKIIKTIVSPTREFAGDCTMTLCKNMALLL